MKSLNKTTAYFVTALVFTLASVGVYTFFFIAVKSKTGASSELSVKLNETSGKEASIATAEIAIRKDADKIEKLSSFYIKEGEIVAFAQKIESLGALSGTRLKIEALDPGLTEKTIPFLSFRIKATGSFSSILKLLNLLENFPGKFEWKTVRLTSIGSADQQSGAGETKKLGVNEWSVEVFINALNFTKE